MQNWISQNDGVRRAYNTGTVPNAATFGDFLDTRNFRKVAFFPQVGDFGTGSIIIEVYQNNQANSSGATAVTGAIGRFLDGTHENMVGVLEVNLDALSGTTQRYVGLRITPPAALGFFSAMALFDVAHSAVTLNGTAQNVAFVTRV